MCTVHYAYSVYREYGEEEEEDRDTPPSGGSPSSLRVVVYTVTVQEVIVYIMLIV